MAAHCSHIKHTHEHTQVCVFLCRQPLVCVRRSLYNFWPFFTSDSICESSGDMTITSPQMSLLLLWLHLPPRTLNVFTGSLCERPVGNRTTVAISEEIWTLCQILTFTLRFTRADRWSAACEVIVVTVTPCVY